MKTVFAEENSDRAPGSERLETAKRTWAEAERARAEAALRESEERQAFLLALSDALRPLQDTLEIEREALQMLGEHLGTSRAHFAHMLLDRSEVRCEIRGGNDPSVVGVHPYTDWSTPGEMVRRGQSFVAGDARSALITDSERERWSRYGIVSLACVPVRRQGVTVVCLAVCDNVPRAWTPREVGFLENIADRTWTAIERARVQNDLAFLAEVSHDLARLATIDETMAALGAKIGEHFAASRVAFGEVDAAQESIRVDHAWDRSELPVFRGVFRIRDFHSEDFQEACRAGKTYVVRDAVGDGRVDPAALAEFNVRAFVSVPLLRDGRWLFQVTVFDPRPRDWRAEEVALVQELTVRIFTRLERARAEEKLRESEARRERRVKNQQFIIDLDRRLGEHGKAEDIEQTAVAALGEFLEVSRCYFAHMREPELAQVEREYRAAPGLASVIATHRFTDYFSPDAVEQFASGQTFAVNDVLKDPRTAVGAESYAPFEIGAFVTASVFYQGQWVAVISATDPAPRVWRDDELEVLREVAARIYPMMERARAEKALRESEARLASVFAALPVGVAFVGLDGRIVLANRKMEQYVPNGTIPSADPNPPRFRGWHANGHPVERRDFPGARALRGETVVPGLEMLFTEEDGSETWTQVTAVPHLDADGKVLGETTVITDIDALKRAQDRLREADRRRIEFLGMLGHELRNPLAALDAGVKLLQSPRTRAESRAAALPVVAQQVSHMTRLINDVLDLARLARGKLQVLLGDADLDAVLLTALRQTDSFAQAKEVAIRYQPPSEPCPLRADAERLVQVFANLLINAVKFSPPGAAVELKVECSEKIAKVEVRDHGRGITAEDLVEIFEPFVQSKFSLGLPEEGLGVGLAVSRQLVELHGGKIQAQSAGAGQGSTFTVTLPRAAESPSG